MSLSIPLLWRINAVWKLHYTTVNCGTRKDPTWACEYMLLHCIIKYFLVLKTCEILLKIKYIHDFFIHEHVLFVFCPLFLLYPIGYYIYNPNLVMRDKHMGITTPKLHTFLCFCLVFFGGGELNGNITSRCLVKYRYYL